MRKREAQTFYDDFSIWPPPPLPPRATPTARPRRAPKVNRLLQTLKLDSSVRTQVLNSLTFFKSQPTLPVRDVIHFPLVIFSIWDFYFDISEWHILPTRAWTPALMLHLTNPCTKRKVLSLTKPKGKIYKTKSLGHYITIKLPSFCFCFCFFFFLVLFCFPIFLFSCRFVVLNIHIIVFLPFSVSKLFLFLLIFMLPVLFLVALSSFSLFFLFFAFLNWCICAVFNAGQSSSSFLSSHEYKVLRIVISFHSSSISRTDSSILHGGRPRCSFLRWSSCCRARFREVFSFTGETLNFLSSPLVSWCPLPIFLNTC